MEEKTPQEQAQDFVKAVGVLAESAVLFYTAAINAGASRDIAGMLTDSFIRNFKSNH